MVGDPHDGIDHGIDCRVVKPVAGVIEHIRGELAILANTVHAAQHLGTRCVCVWGGVRDVPRPKDCKHQ